MDRKYYIYTHVSPSGKVYVGQTVSIKRRWGTNGEHYRTKKKDGTYIQPIFAKAIDKYGWKNFIHNIILEGISKSEADYAEKYLIKWYKLHKISYNITNGGEGCDSPRLPLTVEQRKKISERLLENHPMRGKHWSPEILAKITRANRSRIYTSEQKIAMAERARMLKLGTKATDEVKKKLSDYRKAHPETWIGGWNKKEVYQYDLEGHYITSYPSAAEAAIKIPYIGNPSKISDCIRGKVLSACGYVWKNYKVDKLDLSKYKIVKTKRGARLYDMTETGKRKRRDGHGKPVNQYSLDGKYLATYNSVTDAKECVGGTRSGISKCCLHRNKYKSAAGFRWEYDDGNNRKDLVVETSRRC